MKSTEIIQVKLNKKKVGRLAMSPERMVVFEYDTEWLKTGFAISPFHLPLRSGLFTAKPRPFGGNFGVFADSLPDGWGNLLLDRILRKNQINPHELTQLQRLSFVGHQGMGALEYEPVQTITKLKQNCDLQSLAADIEHILKNEINPVALEVLYQQAGSSAGARPKIMIHEKGKHWLIKFPASSDPSDVGKTEYAYSLLAKKAGLEMPETKLFENQFFGTMRFDRKNRTRVHVISAAGLLNADFRLPSLDYTELIKATRALTRNEKEVMKMFRLMVFNVLIGNRDDHAKNFSFVFENGEWKCSPVYDLLPSRGMSGQHFTSIAGSGNPTEADIYKVANQTSIDYIVAKKVFNEVMEAITA